METAPAAGGNRELGVRLGSIVKLGQIGTEGYLQKFCVNFTAVQVVFNPFSQFVPQLELYSQLQLSLWSDPIAFSVPKST